MKKDLHIQNWKFGNFRENFIFENSVKIHTRDDSQVLILA